MKNNAEEISNKDFTISFLRQLLSLNQLVRHKKNLTATQLVEDLVYSLTNDTDFSDDEKGRWKELENDFGLILDLSVVNSTSKGNELAYDYANLYQKARIITDLRPIFDNSQEDVQIIGGVVGYTLRLEYDNSGVDHNISIALDHSDVVELKELCERAMKKSEAISNKVRETLPSYIAGNE